MENQVVHIALLGLGTVGSGVYRIIQLQKPEMEKKLSASIEIDRILVRNLEKAARKVEDPSVLTNQWSDIIHDDDIRIVVEVMGGIEPAATYIKEALRAHKHVVTANKDLIAQQGVELLELAHQCGVSISFEAAVAGGIPIIAPLMGSLSANHISEIVGIVNGTTNFILSKMTEEGMDFQDALKIATDLGYAEADPTADIEGLDAGRKVAIMATLAFNSEVTFDQVYTEGITQISPHDIQYADEFGHVIKLVGVAKNTAEGIEARVHPMLIPKNHPMATVSGSYNAVFVHGDAVDDVMFYGRGAGDMPTGSAIMGDVFSVVRSLAEGGSPTSVNPCYKHLPVKSIENIVSRYYLRMHVDDKPGVLATVASVLGNNSVSISQVVQKMSHDDDAELVIITDPVKECHLRDALLTFRSMSIVRSEPALIRVY